MLPAYIELLKLWKRVHLLGSVTALLGWDERTKLPPQAYHHRSDQLALMAGLSHELILESSIGKLLDQVESQADFTPGTPLYANVTEIRRRFNRVSKVPKSLSQKLVATKAQTYSAWLKARKQNSFAIFLPYFRTLISLLRQKADALGWTSTPYNVYLEDYEPGFTKVDLVRILDPLALSLQQFLRDLQAAPNPPPSPPLNGRSFPIVAQALLCRDIARAFGYDTTQGRIDTTVHPFCTHLGPGDVRVALRYHPTSLFPGLFGALHEVGHGLYDQGLPRIYYGSPVGEAASTGIHESQSRLWENMVGRSRDFWRYIYPLAVKAFPAALAGVSYEDLYTAANQVRPSLIRVEADEVTYNLHVIIRFRLEAALVEGALNPADLPDAWSQAYASLLGIKVPSDKMGCLQDVHWSQGSIGYFPTYALGNLYAAQLFQAFNQDQGGDGQAPFAAGKFSYLHHWLATQIYSQGMLYPPLDLLQRVTRTPFTSQAFLDYLRVKYGELYKL